MLKSIACSFLILITICFNTRAETFGGLGLTVAQIFDISIASKEGEIVVLGVIPGTDAEEKEVLPGDVISQIDGKNTAGVHFEDLIKSYLRGPVGSTAVLKIRRCGKNELLTISVKRTEITPPSEK